ncbi:BZIP domain-containing protein [Pseudozyma hubeiensis]|nr:BZIP domain-containing protein [Pseudozyma hubeiensis]
MSSPAMASILPSPRPSSSSLAAQRNLAPRTLAPSSSSSSSLKPTPVKPSTSRPAPSAPSPIAKAAASVASPPKIASSSLAPTPPSSSASTPSTATTIIKKEVSAAPLVQPSKEWILPARAKPGRKPSETEPLTKRKAQNRASQRAFRERKQSYLADLEAKIAAYEAAEIDRTVEIQKVAQKLRAENDSLRKEVSVWKDKFAQIERYLIQAKANGGRLPGVTPSVKSGPGCKAPAHERSAAPPKKGVLVAPGTKTDRDRERSAGGVRFADAAKGKAPAQVGSPAEEQPALSVPLPRKLVASSSASTLTRGPSTTAQVSTSATAADAEMQPDVQMVAPRKGPKPPLWTFESTKLPSPDSTSIVAAAVSSNDDMTSTLQSPSLMPHGGHLSVEGGCGFCTEASPCVCADDFLDLSKPAAPSHIAVVSDVPSAVPLPKRGSASGPSETSRRMSIGSLTHAKDVALDQRRRTPNDPAHKKLWYTVTQPKSPPETAAAAAVPLSLKASSRAKTGKKLWSVTEAPVEPVCTGDPSTCGACSTDPGLAAFCEAVTTATDTPSSPSASTLAPSRPGMLRAGTTGQLLAPYPSSGETIPSAWRQIRSHPRFSQWQGGLDLLAEVVSKRSGNVHSPLLSNKRPREASVEIESSRSTTTSATSNDRATSKPVLLHTTSDTTIHSNTRIKIEEEEDGLEAREQKRRRILIDREAVQEALALLDAGTAAQPRAGVVSGNNAGAGKEELPCPCPWRPGERRSP